MAFEADNLIELSLYFIDSTLNIPIPILIPKKKDNDKEPNK